MSFAPNRGQAEPGAGFLSTGIGYAAVLAPTHATLSLQSRSPRPSVPLAAAAAAVPSSREVSVDMQFLGGNPAAVPSTDGALPGKVNYVTGADPARWHTNIATFGRVTYRGVYPGIDTTYYGDQAQLEYDLTVAPGTDPSVVRLGFAGVEAAHIDTSGELVLHTAQGDVVEHKPVAYQQRAGTRTYVSAAFTMLSGSEVGFQVAHYDASRPLVIDPVVEYSTFLGGSGNEEGGYSIATDVYGNAYVTGGTAPPPGQPPMGSTDFPTTAGSFEPSPGDAHGDAFVAKISADGSTLLYSTLIGGSGFDDGAGIAVDDGGHAYVRGVTRSVDFPTTPGAFQPHQKGRSFNAWVAKLSPDGSQLIYSTYLGGSGFNSGAGIAIDRRGSAYLPGVTGSPDFPTTPGAFDRSFHGQLTTTPPLLPGDFDAFVTKLTPDGSALAYSTFLGGSNLDVGFSIAVDLLGNAYVTGDTKSADFPTTPGAFDTTFNGVVDAFASKLNQSGSALAYSTFLGGSAFDDGLGITVDYWGDAYVTGGTESADFPTTAWAFQRKLHGTRNGYVTKFNRDGSSVVFSTLLGGSNYDYGDAIAIDLLDNIYVTGGTNSPDFPTTPQAVHAALGDRAPGDPNLSDAFLTKVDRSGSSLGYSTYLGGGDYDQGVGIAVDHRINVYVTGVTSSADFPTTEALQAKLRGSANGFVTKFSFLWG